VPAQPPVGVEPRAAARPVPEPVAVPSPARRRPLWSWSRTWTPATSRSGEAAEQRDDAPAEPEPALSTPASLGFFA
jgi:hypothetical protein